MTRAIGIVVAIIQTAAALALVATTVAYAFDGDFLAAIVLAGVGAVVSVAVVALWRDRSGDRDRDL